MEWLRNLYSISMAGKDKSNDAVYQKFFQFSMEWMRNLHTISMGAKDGQDKYDSEDEARRLLKEINIAMEEVQESQFYAKLREQIASVDFQNQLKSVLGSRSELSMVLYALGSLAYKFESHYQLAIALLLEQDCSWIQGIEVYDPILVPADVIVLKELGCNVLTFNERCGRRVEEPTLFYMPYPDYYLVGNLLEANWCPSQINKLIILTNRIKNPSKDDLIDQYTKAIQNHTKEMVMENYGGVYDNIIYNFAWHFFEVDSKMDMETLFEGKFSKKAILMRRWYQKVHFQREPSDILSQERTAEVTFRLPFMRGTSVEEGGEKCWAEYFRSYRGPRKYRCHSNAPPKDWIKLKISGIGAHGNIPAGFGGICYDEFMKPILIYKGFLDKNVDESAACVEALRHGLTELLNKSDYRNLIVEGDNLQVIQWANKRHKAYKPAEEIGRASKRHKADRSPEEMGPSLEEVIDLLKEFNCAVYHTYEEANMKAKNLAKKGATSGRKLLT